MSNEVGELVNLLTVGLHHAQLYFPDHPRVRECAEEFSRRAGDAAARAPDGAFRLGVVGGRLVHEGRVLLGPTLTAKRLLDAAAKLRCGGFAFPTDVRANDVLALFTACAALRATVASVEEGQALLARHGAVTLRLSGETREGAAGGSGGGACPQAAPVLADPEEAAALDRAVPEYQNLLELVETSHASTGGGRALDPAGARGIVEKVLPDLLERPADLLGLARYPDFDSYTVGHSVRVALLTVLAGHRIGFPPHMLVELGAAGLLHDVGKGRIPDAILMKRGPLDDEERRIMKQHPVLGAEVLLATKDAPAFAVAAAWGHHLRSDGKGYPDSAPWARSSTVTALVHVCDVFEALTAVRPYKPSWSPQRALSIMLEDRGAYDPSAFGAFVSAIGFYPPGSRVRLRDGSEALVLRSGAHPARPVVEVRRTAAGAALPPGDRVELDLAAPGAPQVERFADDDLLARELSEEAQAPRPAHDLIEEAGACVAEAGPPR